MTRAPSLLDLLSAAAERLKRAGIEDAAREARFLAAAALNLSRAELVLHENREATEAQQQALEPFLARREAREPLSRILGRREFWGLTFETNEATLDPRPDSETLIEAALGLFPLPSCHSRESGNPESASAHRMSPLAHGSKSLDQNSDRLSLFPHKGEDLRLLDLGTGTGCLLLSLLHEIPEAVGLGVDKAPRALEAARKNAAFLHLENRARFVLGTWEDGLACLEGEKPFDLILSNPPYIPSQDLKRLMPEVKNHDPALALDGGEDGLDAYRALIPLARKALAPGGVLLLEIGQGQEQSVACLLQQTGFTSIETRRDLGGIVRCVMGQRAP